MSTRCGASASVAATAEVAAGLHVYVSPPGGAAARAAALVTAPTSAFTSTFTSAATSTVASAFAPLATVVRAPAFASSDLPLALPLAFAPAAPGLAAAFAAFAAFAVAAVAALASAASALAFALASLRWWGKGLLATRSPEAERVQPVVGLARVRVG